MAVRTGHVSFPRAGPKRSPGVAQKKVKGGPAVGMELAALPFSASLTGPGQRKEGLAGAAGRGQKDILES